MQTTEIKIGDKIKARNTLYCAYGLWGPKAGDVYTVRDYEDGFSAIWLDLQEDPDISKRRELCNWAADQFELVEEQNTTSTACIQPLQNEAGGIKYDQGKLRYTLLLQDLPRAVKEVVEVLEFGAKKYERLNFEKVESHRYDEAMCRHLMSYLSGETTDPESGKHHLSHLVCCALFLIEREVKKNETTCN